MAKDDFDLDFDFEKEYGFDPKSFLGDEDYDDTAEPQFTDAELGLTDLPEEDAAASDDASFDDLDMDAEDFLNLRFDEDETPAEDPEQEDAAYFPEEEEAPAPSDQEPEDLADPDTEEQDMTDYSQEEYSEEEVEETPKRQRQRRPKKPRKPIKIAVPTVFTKFYDLYFAPVLNKNQQQEPQDPDNPRRRRRKSKAQIFKEVYLPAIIVCLCLILVLAFAIGALSNFIEQRKIDKDTEQSRLDASQSAEVQAQAEADAILEEAAALAAGYDYDAAIELLESYGDLTDYPELAAARSTYLTEQSQLVEFSDPSSIPNLSFHPLIVDYTRAFADEELGGSYNRNFVLLEEFTKILNALYDNGYVLVDFDSFTENVNGTIYTESIYLPDGKKPVMLTETLMGYYNYMVDGDGDGEPDAGGDGFANKLVLDSNGDIKAAYVDADGNSLVGDYDLVPILESFIAEHPDFSYRGARAILATTGDEGIFGYRTNTSYIATKGQTYYDEQVAGAKVIVEALQEKGYTLACFTYANADYGDYNANQITSDLQSWASEITPIIGSVDVLVYARAADISDYSGSSFNVMYASGFRYFVTNSTTASTEVYSTYVRQKRLMVTGNALAWSQSQFTDLFEPNAVINLTARGNVPN